MPTLDTSSPSLLAGPGDTEMQLSPLSWAFRSSSIYIFPRTKTKAIMPYNDSVEVLVKNYTMCKHKAADVSFRHRHLMKSRLKVYILLTLTGLGGKL